MKKLAITRCDECPHFDTKMSLGDKVLEYCGFNESKLIQLKDSSEIPDFCMLENYFQGTKGSVYREIETYIENMDEIEDVKEILKMQNILWILGNGGE